ncbi:hypothetical protein HPB47_017288 [Ixodes persulcatus]|uniref:Uncharacterized protein n=1 Tax=Ixodes persulcatus TaxID=34615 RepID=A0AC60QNQ2_IXOPE|nr:hypothetical protein HPB47_017288 [Ixodes persulcatus]
MFAADVLSYNLRNWQPLETLVKFALPAVYDSPLLLCPTNNKAHRRDLIHLVCTKFFRPLLVNYAFCHTDRNDRFKMFARKPLSRKFQKRLMGFSPSCRRARRYLAIRPSGGSPAPFGKGHGLHRTTRTPSWRHHAGTTRTFCRPPLHCRSHELTGIVRPTKGVRPRRQKRMDLGLVTVSVSPPATTREEGKEELPTSRECLLCVAEVATPRRSFDRPETTYVTIALDVTWSPLGLLRALARLGCL